MTRGQTFTPTKTTIDVVIDQKNCMKGKAKTLKEASVRKTKSESQYSKKE